MEAQAALTCPECNSILPASRQESLWCECGWTSVRDDDLLQLNIPKNYRRWIEKDRRHAHQLAEVDARILKKVETRWGRLRWRSRLVLLILLSAPFFIGPVLLWTALLLGWGYTLWLGIPALKIVASLILAGTFLFHWLVKTKSSDPPVIHISAQQAPELYAVLAEVAARMHMPPIQKVDLYLEPQVGIEIQQIWKSGWRKVPTLGLGLLSAYALKETQFKAILAHEIGHLQQNNHLTEQYVYRAIRQMEELAGYQSVLRVLGLFGIPLWLLVGQYLHLVVRISLSTIRSREYMADRAAARAYGRAPFLAGLIELYAARKKYGEYLPIMAENIDNKIDSHDFFFQFTHHWEALNPALREALYARAMAENSSVYDTHPSYKDRRQALADFADFVDGEQGGESTLALIPNAAELGRELTIEMYRFWNAQG